MTQYGSRLLIFPLTLLIFLCQLGCKGEQKETDSKALPDLNAQLRPYVTIENTKLRSRPWTSVSNDQRNQARCQRSKSLDGMVIGFSSFRRRATRPATSK